MKRYEGTQLPQIREIRYNKISVTTVRVIFHVYIDVNESINLSMVVEIWYFDMLVIQTFIQDNVKLLKLQQIHLN